MVRAFCKPVSFLSLNLRMPRYTRAARHCIASQHALAMTALHAHHGLVFISGAARHDALHGLPISAAAAPPRMAIAAALCHTG